MKKYLENSQAFFFLVFYLVEREEVFELVRTSCSVEAKSKDVRPNDLQILLQLCEWKKRAMPFVPKLPSPYSVPKNEKNIGLQQCWFKMHRRTLKYWKIHLKLVKRKNSMTVHICGMNSVDFLLNMMHMGWKYRGGGQGCQNKIA